MTRLWTRRETLHALGGLGAALAGPRLAGRAPGRTARTTRAPSAAIAELAETLKRATRARALEHAADAIRAGASIETVLGAVLLVGVEDVRPRPHGILHTVMMVHSTFALTEGAGEREAWLAVLWNLDDLKSAQERDRADYGDWSMPPRPDVRSSGAEAARAELRAALDAWDPERADRAVVALLLHVDLDALFQLLWPFAARCGAFIGHKIIYAAQLERALRRLPRELLEPAARSLVRTLLVDSDVEAWEANVERVAEPPAASERPADRDRALLLFRELRAAKASEAVSTTLAALEEGYTDDDAWNALRLFGSEVFLRRSGRRSIEGRNALLPVHALTVVNALGHAARQTPDARLSRIVLLQAAAWLPPMRDWLSESTGLRSAPTPVLTHLGQERTDEAPPSLEEALATGSPDAVRAHLESGSTNLAEYGSRLRTALLRTGREHHQHKYTVAMLEEAGLAPAALRPLVLAPACDYVAHPEDTVTELHERSLHALDRVGIR